MKKVLSVIAILFVLLLAADRGLRAERLLCRKDQAFRPGTATNILGPEARIGRVKANFLPPFLEVRDIVASGRPRKRGGNRPQDQGLPEPGAAHPEEDTASLHLHPGAAYQPGALSRRRLQYPPLVGTDQGESRQAGEGDEPAFSLLLQNDHGQAGGDPVQGRRRCRPRRRSRDWT